MPVNSRVNRSVNALWNDTGISTGTRASPGHASEYGLQFRRQAPIQALQKIEMLEFGLWGTQAADFHARRAAGTTTICVGPILSRVL